MIRSAILMGLFLIVPALAMPRIGRAQSLQPGLEGEVVMGFTAGVASGPSRSAVGSVTLDVAPRRGWTVRGGLEAWQGGFGVSCVQSFPESYACDASGWSGRLGMVMSPVQIWRLLPFALAEGGLHVRDGPGGQTTRSPAVAFGFGTGVALGNRVLLRLGVRQVWVEDEGFEELMNEALELSTLFVGLAWRFRL